MWPKYGGSLGDDRELHLECLLYLVVHVLPVIEGDELKGGEHRPQKVVEVGVAVVWVRAHTQARVALIAMPVIACVNHSGESRGYGDFSRVLWRRSFWQLVTFEQYIPLSKYSTLREAIICARVFFYVGSGDSFIFPLSYRRLKLKFRVYIIS
jgi:hypothetical protein